jgi:hypothetical protein
MARKKFVTFVMKKMIFHAMFFSKYAIVKVKQDAAFVDSFLSDWELGLPANLVPGVEKVVYVDFSCGRGGGCFNRDRVARVE